jgi:sugar/nucleoside kinase (ribokinase family)
MPRFDGAPAAELLHFAKESGVVTSMDVLGVRHPDPLPVLEPALPYLDYFMPNLAEARRICGIADPLLAARFFVERGAGACVVKMDERGSVIVSREVEIRLPAFHVPVVDTTGCGDAYCAGFIVALSMGWDLERAGRLGTATAGLVAGGLGSDAGVTDLPQTLKFLEGAEPRFVHPSETHGYGQSLPG